MFTRKWCNKYTLCTYYVVRKGAILQTIADEIPIAFLTASRILFCFQGYI